MTKIFRQQILEINYLKNTMQLNNLMTKIFRQQLLEINYLKNPMQLNNLQYTNIQYNDYT